MLVRKLVFALLAVLTVSIGVTGQEKPATTVKHVPLKSVSPTSGKDMFANYCASCHGADGKGNGPAAAALRILPANLTVLSQKNGGNYPAMRIASILRGDAELSAHGSKEMPVWGPLFRSVSGGHESEVQQRISNLTTYIETLQVK
jgi:mono/diheme cytochrome c family protein